MSVRYWLTGILAATLFTRGTIALAENPGPEPVLGIAVLIGSLISAEEDSEEASHLVIEFANDTATQKLGVKSQLMPALSHDFAPQLGRPIMLASLLPQEYEEATPVVVVDPQEIQQHLSQAIDLLQKAGLDNHAKAIDSIVNDIESSHMDRLSLAFKRAERAKLQAEIVELYGRMNENFDAEQVLLSVQVFEVDQEIASDLPKDLDAQEFRKLMKDLSDKNAINMLSRPMIRAFSAYSASVSTVNHVEKRSFSLDVTPTIINPNCVRLFMFMEKTEATPTDENQSSHVSKRRVQATQELNKGHVIMMNLGAANDASKVTIVSITGGVADSK